MDDYLKKKINAFRDMHLWPTEMKMEVNAWISSFPGKDRWVAELLLRNLIYLNEAITEQLLSHAIISAAYPLSVNDSKIIYTWPSTAINDNTESGRQYSRMMRDRFSVKPANFVSPTDAIKKALCKQYDRVILVDDLLGSGSQLLHSLSQPCQIFSEDDTLIEHIESTHTLSFSACFAVASSPTVEQLSRQYPGLEIVPGALLEPEHGIVSEDSLAFQNQEEADDVRAAVVRLTKERLDINSAEAFGLINEGHLLMFEHGPPPDLTIPLIHTGGPDWTPLRRRQ